MDVLDSVVIITKKLKNKKLESEYTIGHLENVSNEEINALVVLKQRQLAQIFKKNNEEIDDLSNIEGLTVKLEIKTGDIPNYFETSKDFISGNKLECKLIDFYIVENDYREKTDNNNNIKKYKINLQIIDFLSSISDYKKNLGNELELFFYKFGNGINLKIEYEFEHLINLDLIIPEGFKNKFSDSYKDEDRKQLFINELISFLEKNGNSYLTVIENWGTLISNYEKSYALFLAGFSFEKIKTSSTEHFQKIVERIYDSISKASNYIFGIPIGYILLINNFDFSGELLSKNICLLILASVFMVLIWHVLFKNIDESLTSIEKDINDFSNKIKNVKELEEIETKLKGLKNDELEKQRIKLKIVKGLTIFVYVIIVFIFLYIFLDLSIFNI